MKCSPGYQNAQAKRDGRTCQKMLDTSRDIPWLANWKLGFVSYVSRIYVSYVSWKCVVFVFFLRSINPLYSSYIVYNN